MSSSETYTAINDCLGMLRRMSGPILPPAYPHAPVVMPALRSSERRTVAPGAA